MDPKRGRVGASKVFSSRFSRRRAHCGVAADAQKLAVQNVSSDLRRNLRCGAGADWRGELWIRKSLLGLRAVKLEN